MNECGCFHQDDINLIYENKIREARIKNIKAVYDDTETKLKVKNFAERFDYDEALVWKRMNDDFMFALTFAKDPGRQTIHQTIAADYIKKLPTIDQFEILPAGGNKALYCCDGNVVGKDKIGDKAIKSIDFKWTYIFKNKELMFYATHKHTDGAGGAQDNQFNDVVNFQENAKKCNEKNIFLLSITDGEYYMGTYNKNGTIYGNKIEFLDTAFRGRRNAATNSNGLLKKIIPILIEWLYDNFEEFEIIDEIKRLDELEKEALIY